MKKNLLFIFSIVFVLFITGCQSSISFTYSVETGDNIKVELDTSDGYKLTSEVPFSISKDDKVLSKGTFLTLDGYNSYVEAIHTDSDAKTIDNGNKNGVTYIFYSYSDKEYNYLIKIDDSNTSILINNNESKESAEEIFSKLQFTKE